VKGLPGFPEAKLFLADFRPHLSKDDGRQIYGPIIFFFYGRFLSQFRRISDRLSKLNISYTIKNVSLYSVSVCEGCGAEAAELPGPRELATWQQSGQLHEMDRNGRTHGQDSIRFSRPTHGL
jgi:hypothetical protein